MDMNFYQQPESDVAPSPEQALWHGVFIHALREALRFDQKAINYLTLDSDDLSRVMEYAGTNAEYVRPRVATLILSMALSITSGREPYAVVDHRGAVTGEVIWRTPNKTSLTAARRFLDSYTARHVRAVAKLPASEDEREQNLQRAVLLSRVAA